MDTVSLKRTSSKWHCGGTYDGHLLTVLIYSFPTKQKQILRYVSDRTGIISFANFPIIWLFGMRNNMLMWATGWGFGTYNNFHRWVARIATVQAIIHSIGYTILIFIGMSSVPEIIAITNMQTRGRLELLPLLVDAHVLVGRGTGKQTRTISLGLNLTEI